jgi:hypothetical protein
MEDYDIFMACRYAIAFSLGLPRSPERGEITASVRRLSRELPEGFRQSLGQMMDGRAISTTEAYIELMGDLKTFQSAPHDFRYSMRIARFHFRRGKRPLPHEKTMKKRLIQSTLYKEVAHGVWEKTAH